MSIPRRKKESEKISSEEKSSTQRRRSRSTRKTAAKTQVAHASVVEAEVKSKTAKKTARKSRKREVDTDKLASEYFNDLYTYLGLDTLGVSRELSLKIISEILAMLYEGSSSKPTLDAVLKKIKRFREQVNAVIAKWLLENVSNPPPEQLEFIVQYGGQVAVPEITKLYSLITKMNREDLLSYLEALWEKHGNPTPVKCPKCGFRAVMPDYTCFVCGSVVSEDYVRRELGFDEKFRMYVQQASVAELRDVMDMGFVLLGEDGVVSPRYRSKLASERKYYYTVYLKRKDVSVILEDISQRKLEI